MTQKNIVETLVQSYETTKNVNDYLYNDGTYTWEKSYKYTIEKRHEIENCLTTLFATGIINKNNFKTGLNELSKIDGYNGD